MLAKRDTLHIKTQIFEKQNDRSKMHHGNNQQEKARVTI